VHKSESKGKVSIRIDLTGKLLEMFEAIKHEWMIENNTDVIRHLIADKYKHIKSEKKE